MNGPALRSPYGRKLLYLVAKLMGASDVGLDHGKRY